MAGRRKKDRELGIARPALGLVAGATILGVGGSVVVGVGGPTAASAGAGLTAAASFLPPLGVVVGSGIVVRGLRGLQEQVEPKRKRRR